jgi:hypothetical protein
MSSGTVAPTCAELNLKDACILASKEGSACSDDTVIPWNRLFLCTGQHLGIVAFAAFVCLLISIALVVMWIGVNLLSKVRS